MGIPTAKLKLQQGGWLLGDAVESLLSETTYLTYSGFADITADVRTISVRRGRQHELDRMEAGTAVVALRNPDGQYDPTNVSSPLAPDVRPMVRMVLTATWEAVEYPVFFMYAERWPQVFTRGPDGDAWVTVTLVDAFKPLNLDTVTVSRPQESTGARVNAILDAADWPPGERLIDDGISEVQAQTLENQSVLGYLQLVADSEGGPLFVGRDGAVVFQDRARTVETEVDTVNDVWGDFGVEKDYDDVVISFDDSNIWNHVHVSAPDLQTQQAEDESSRGRYFRRVLTRSTVLATENEMSDHAHGLLTRYSEPAIRFEVVRLEARGDDTQWSRILGHELHDKVRIVKRPPGGGTILQDCFIEGIRHDIAGNRWRVEWSLSPTDRVSDYWVLDSVERSVLDSTTVLFF